MTPTQDSIVRTEAGRLRARLGEYYKGEGNGDALVIELPKGGYVPVFRQAVGAPEATARSRDWRGAQARQMVALRGDCLRSSPRHGRGMVAYSVPKRAHSDCCFTPDYHEPGSKTATTSPTDSPARSFETLRSLTAWWCAPKPRRSFFKGKPQNVREAGRQLNADYIVEGSVLRAGQQLRIDAQLVRVRDDFPLWSGRYDRELTDIFAIQDEISRGIVNSLRLKFGRGRRRYETSVEAYDLYLRARALGGGGAFGQPGFRRSLPVFEQAIAKDPTFAPAYAGLAIAHVALSGNFNNDIPEEVAKMRPAAERAVQLDPLSAEAYDALRAAYAREAQWEQSERKASSTLSRSSLAARSHTLISPPTFFCRSDVSSRQSSTCESRRKNDPLSSWVHYWLGDALADAGRNEEGWRRLREAIAIKREQGGMCSRCPRTSREGHRCDSDL